MRFINNWLEAYVLPRRAESAMIQNSIEHNEKTVMNLRSVSIQKNRKFSSDIITQVDVRM